MKALGFVRAAALAAAALLPFAGGQAQAQEWRGWNIHAADYPNGRGMDRFGELVMQRTNNRIRMRTFHSAQLGQQDEAIQQMRLGAIDFGNFNLSPFNNLAPSTNVVTLPFLFRNVAHSHAAIDGVAGAEIARDLEAIGIIALAWYDAGAFAIYAPEHLAAGSAIPPWLGHVLPRTRAVDIDTAEDLAMAELLFRAQRGDA